jgi:hypothetical protein
MNQRLAVIILPKALDFPPGLRLCSALATANAGFSPELYGRLEFRSRNDSAAPPSTGTAEEN